jgi:multiple sugar transport system substrate-binding protein
MSLVSTAMFAAPSQAGVVRHALWDAGQKPMYQHCAKDFERANPGVRIRLQQLGWDDYWGSLATGFVAGTAPDVFTNHMIKFAEQVVNGVLLDVAPLIARDGVRTDIFEDGLFANWGRSETGKSARAQYALPADWDTIAIVVNLGLAQQAGVSHLELQQMSWNPRDGGTLGHIAAKLTLDKSGRNALHPAFDKRQVKQFGYQVPGPGGMFGQSEWSHFAASNGFRYQDTAWQAPLRYDDPALAQTIDWLASLTPRGISASKEATGKEGPEALFVTGRAAMVPTGPWMLDYFTRNAKFAHAFVPLPVGPLGFRASMLNGLAHSIWRGSKNQAEAWAWVRYLGSEQCQRVVANYGMVYPAVRGLAAVSADVQRQRGADPSAFLAMAQGKTFSPPIADHAAQINDLLDLAIEQVLLGKSPAAPALRAANIKANNLLRTP